MSIKSITYTYRYIYKGVIEENNKDDVYDEITQLENSIKQVRNNIDRMV